MNELQEAVELGKKEQSLLDKEYNIALVFYF
jgi:hypothetical protein